MKLFLIGAVSLAVAQAEEGTGANLPQLNYNTGYDVDAAIDGDRSVEGAAFMSDVSGMDLVLSTALNQAVSSTLVPIVGLAGGFARSAVAFVGSLNALKPQHMGPTSFYGTISEVIQSFANPSTGQITSPVSMDEFLSRLREALSAQSVVDFDSFKRVCHNLTHIVLLYPFVTTGAYLTYLSQVLGTLQAVLNASAPTEPTQRPATIPLAPHTHPLQTSISRIIPSIRVDPYNLNIPNFGWTGNVDGGLMGQLNAFKSAIKGGGLGFNPPTVDTIMNPGFLGLDNLKSPLFTGINALGAINAVKTSAASSLLDPVSREPTLNQIETPIFQPITPVGATDGAETGILPSLAAQIGSIGTLPFVAKMQAILPPEKILAAKQAFDAALLQLAAPFTAPFMGGADQPGLLPHPPLYATLAGPHSLVGAQTIDPDTPLHPFLASHPALAAHPTLANHLMALHPQSTAAPTTTARPTTQPTTPDTSPATAAYSVVHPPLTLSNGWEPARNSINSISLHPVLAAHINANGPLAARAQQLANLLSEGAEDTETP